MDINQAVRHVRSLHRLVKLLNEQGNEDMAARMAFNVEGLRMALDINFDESGDIPKPPSRSTREVLSEGSVANLFGGRKRG